ncbi:MAG: S8 family serine peptidase [Bacteriovoracaceae bacterium]|nr:S8 family serine peptidase [Bacteriovoracaceae bacterium]
MGVTNRSIKLHTVVGDIISNRPQNQDQFFAILRLKNSALLENPKIESGRTIVDEGLKKEIIKEQEEMIAELKKMSDQIRVVYKYKFVLNGLAVVAPKSLEKDLVAHAGFSYIEKSGSFSRPQTTTQDLGGDEAVDLSTLQDMNSTTFIGSKLAREKYGLYGEGISVGIIDSGIDYTHKMLGGIGTEKAYEDNDPDSVDASSFPNSKVVGGIDLVGTAYDASSPVFAKHIPKPDGNPLDEGGHGTHVAGTVAGIGDGLETYSGVAPKAKLHAIKVFGKNGSTGDPVILAALEYAMDPNSDMDPSDKLDVVNLSLGSPFGKPHIMYTEAIKNAHNGGLIVVASAGNSGHDSYITGAPGSVNEAISVAASVDGMGHNWKFRSVKFSNSGPEDIFTEAIEGNFSKPIKEAGDISGKLVFIGDAATDLSDEVKAKLKTHIALIDRGAVAFVDKFKRAVEAGAIGVVVANNKEGSPIAMGGSNKHDVPGIMITRTLGLKLKDMMKVADVTINFKTDKKIEKPELIDTLTGFSSRGPRSQDSLIKPEISAPGASIISAKMGGGHAPTKMSGTSMSSPHIAGVMALLVEKYKNASADDLKSILLGTAKTISDKEGKDYAIAQQGAGRVRIGSALEAKLLSYPQTLSLGQIQIAGKKKIRRKIKIKNITGLDLSLKVEVSKNEGLVIELGDELVLKAGEEKTVIVSATLIASKKDDPVEELDGFIKFKDGDSEFLRIPFLAVTKRLSNIKASDYLVYASSQQDAPGAAVDLKLENSGKNAGDALIFNLIGQDSRKDVAGKQSSTRSRNCDLQAAGYRVLEKEVEGDTIQILQFGIKLYQAVTTWQPCEVSVLIDSDGDGTAEQELVAINHDNLKGLDGNKYNSLLLDALKIRETRKSFEEEKTKAPEDKDIKEDYKSSIVDVQEFQFYNHSTVSVVEVDVAKLALTKNGTLNFKLVVINEDRGAIQADDYLDASFDKWLSLNPALSGGGVTGMSEKIVVAANSSQSVSLEKGEGEEELLVLFPQNQVPLSISSKDLQMSSLKSEFVYK